MSTVADLQQEIIIGYISVAAKVLVLFESITTVSYEAETIWARKWTAMTWIYALTRYSVALDSINMLIPSFTPEKCSATNYIDDIFVLTGYISSACFYSLRVYALDGRYVTAGLVLLLNLVPFATNLFGSIKSTVVQLDSEICTILLAPSVTQDLMLRLSLTTRISVVIGDIIVLIVTWLKTARAYREAQRLNVEAPLATMLFLDGTLYFIVLLVINVLDVIAHIAPNLLNGADTILPFFQILPPIIICRFILNLRRIKPEEESSVFGLKQSHSLRFVGNMGQSLQMSSDADDDDEGEYGVEVYPAQAKDVELDDASGSQLECEREYGVYEMQRTISETHSMHSDV